MSDWREIDNLPPEEKAKIKYNDPRLDAYAEATEDHYGIPRGVLVAMKNAGERSNTEQVSKKGAAGVMQFTPITQKDYPHDVSDPLSSIDAAGKYMSKLIDQFDGNVQAAMIAYNWGPANVKRQGVEKAPKESKDYFERAAKYSRERYPVRQETVIEEQKGIFKPDAEMSSSEMIKELKGKNRPLSDASDILNEGNVNAAEG